jgi:acyl-CoA hydrolase
MIPDNARVYVTGLMGTPTALVSALADHHRGWSRLTTVADYLFEPLPTFGLPPEVEPVDWPFRHVTVQPSGATSAVAHDRLAVVPAHSSGFYRLFSPGGPLAVDVALVQVSPPGADGTFSLGVAGGAAPEVLCTADIVIAEVNPQMPHVGGVVAFGRNHFDVLVEVEHELTCLPGAKADGHATTADPESVPGRIAGHLISEIVDGATIEYGIGAIPDAVVAALVDHTALGLHSGLIGEAAMGLIDSGAMDGSAKAVDQGLHVASAVVGGQAAVDWIRERDDVAIVASNYSHGIDSLARQDRFVAINSAVEVALDGSVNAEQVGPRVISGPGGQPDFAAGAALSPGGIAIVALPSTARGATTSRIVCRLESSVPATVPRYLADRVVTEHGVARLRGVTLAERREQLLRISDDVFRASLAEQ